MALRWKLVLSHLLVVLLCLVAFQGSGRSLAWKAGLVLIGGAVAVFWISTRYTRAIKRLSEAAQKMAAGDFARTIPVRSKDEFGQLARHMEQMSSRLQSRLQRLDSERNYLTTVLNSMAEAVLATDSRGRITEVNPVFHRIFGLAADPLGRMPLEVIRNPEVQAGIQNVLRKGIFEREEIRVDDKALAAQFRDHLERVFERFYRCRRRESLEKTPGGRSNRGRYRSP